MVCVDGVFRLGRIKATHRLHARRIFEKTSIFFSVYAGFVDVVIFENRQNFLTANANGECCSWNFSSCVITDLRRRNGKFGAETKATRSLLRKTAPGSKLTNWINSKSPYFAELCGKVCRLVGVQRQNARIAGYEACFE